MERTKTSVLEDAVPTESLSARELTDLVRRVFAPRPQDRALAVLVDLPDEETPDNERWKVRRELAAGWVRELASARYEHGLNVALFLYRNVRSNNANLPPAAWRWQHGPLPETCAPLVGQPEEPLEKILTKYQLIIAPTEFSATAPLKMMAPRCGCRAATMPGFSPAMVPALRLDYNEVNRRVATLKDLLDRSVEADLLFTVDDAEQHFLHLDLRHRTGHASGGLLRQPGTAGNLPSGEAYIVPYEGELPGDPTTSRGTLPVQIGSEVVVFEIEDNRAQRIISSGSQSTAEAKLLAAEPARGNLAELGLGVLADFGVSPIGEVLLDEKLGLHLAFGRSEHFGGQVGPAEFSRPDAVIHQDHVYLRALQPRVAASRVTLGLVGGGTVELIHDGRYVLDFST